MSNFCAFRPGSLLDELNYLKKLGFDQKKENEIWNKFCLDCDVDDDKKVATPKFSSHPNRLCSETDASAGSSRHNSVSSKSSDLIGNVDHIRENKKKVRKHSTQSDSYQSDLGMGDGCSITPRNVDDSDKIITYYDRGEILSKEQSIKFKKTIQSKKIVPPLKNVQQKVHSTQNSYRNVVTDSVFEKKFKLFVEKGLHTLNDIRAQLERGINPPDGEEDESRRIVRVKEFSNRFSRNYLYPLARQLEDLVEIDPFTSTVNQKLLSAYQVVLNGLQAYNSHLPSSTGTCSSDKLKTLLRHLLELCRVHSGAIGSREEHTDDDFLNTLRLNVELTLQKIEEKFGAKSSDVALKISNNAKSSVKASKNKVGKGNIQARLSMYNEQATAIRRDPQWRKMMEFWARRRANAKSRYKTAVYRHRPPLEKKSPTLVPSKSKLLSKKSSTALKRTPVMTPVNEDNITTLIQMEDSKDKEKDKKVSLHSEDEAANPTESEADHEGVVVKLLQLVLDNNRKRVNGGRDEEEAEGQDAKVAEILREFKAGGQVEALRRVVEVLRGAKEHRQQLELQIVETKTNLDEDKAKKKKEPIVTVSGAKNARLICITDENSIVETEDDASKSKDKDSSTEKRVPAKTVSSTETQTEVTGNKKNKSTQKTKKIDKLKMKRISKCTRRLEMLPKNYAVNVIQYKLDFHKHCKQNPMYRKTANVQPWLLMAKISDELLDGALLGVAGEIKLDDIVRQIYESELQLL